MMNLTYTTKNPHGLTREMLIDEMLNKRALLDIAAHEQGLENNSTIELFKMNENGENYITMKKFYDTVKAASYFEFFGFDF